MEGGQRVIVGVTGSVGNLEALRCAAMEARRREAALIAVHVWIPPGGDMAERRCSVPELRQVWREAAWRRMWDAFDAALGGLPLDLQVEPVVRRGDPGRTLVMTADRENDLLVVGAGRPGVLSRLLRRRVSGYCMNHAACPVLVVPPSELAREMEHHPLHAWMVRHRALVPGKNEVTGHPG